MKNIYKTLLFVALLFGVSKAGNIVSAKGTYPACINEDTYSEFVSAIVSSGNYESLSVYSRRGCTIIKTGTSLTILERNWSTSKVMFFDNLLSQRKEIMYTAIEAVR